MSARLALGLVLVATVALQSAIVDAQTVYKWKDANGATHYSDSPPPAGKADRLTLRGDTAASEREKPAAASSSAAPPVDDRSPELKAAEAQHQARSCEAARRDVQAVQSGSMLVDASDPTKARRLDEGQRQDALAAAQDRVKQYCGAEGGQP